jgi:hypothetical protein
MTAGAQDHEPADGPRRRPSRPREPEYPAVRSASVGTLASCPQHHVERVPTYRRGAGQRSLPLSGVVVVTNRAPSSPLSGVVLAGRVAEQRNVPLVILRSGAAARSPLPMCLVPRTMRQIAVIDLPRDLPAALRERLPEFESDRQLITRKFRHSDVGIKRTLAIVLGRMLGWQTALFLDDDIRPTPLSTGRIVGGLADPFGEGTLRLDDVLADFAADPRLQVAGYDATDFHDHSVMGHIQHMLGYERHTSIGGGALVVRCAAPLPFFGAGYNEDWLFLLGVMLGEPSCMPSSAVKHVGPVYQERYNPFLARRAKAEEFGDLLGEGLFSMLGLPREELLATASSPGYWTARGRDRRDQLSDLASQVRALDRDDADRAFEAVQASLSVYVQTPRWPEHLARFVRTWQSDLAGWPAVLDGMTPTSRQNAHDLSSAIALLGLARHTALLGGQAGNVTALRGRGA